MRLLITGATGFVGRAFLLQALQSGKTEKIYALVRNPQKLLKQLKEEGYTECPSALSILQGEAPAWVDLPEVDCAVHCAAVLFANRQEEFFSANVEGTRALFRKLKPTTKVVVISSVAAVGPCIEGLFRTETQTPRPIGWYGRSKLAMEEMLESEFGDREFILIRPPVVLGEGDIAFLPAFQMARQRLRLKPGVRKRVYSYIDVEDLCNVIWAFLNRHSEWKSFPHRKWFVAASGEVSDVEMLRQAGTRKGWALPVPSQVVMLIAFFAERLPLLRRWLPTLTVDKAREMRALRWTVSNEAVSGILGWNAKKNYAESMNAMRAWYIKKGLLPADRTSAQPLRRDLSGTVS